MKNLLIGLCFLSSLSTYSQNIELIGAINKNIFFDFEGDEPHFRSSYNSKTAYSINFGIEDVKIADLFKLRLTLGFDKYSGGLQISNGALARRTNTEAELDKAVISLGVFPLNFKIADKIDLNLGFKLSGLVNENIKGTSRSWGVNNPNGSIEDINDKYKRYSAIIHFGLKGRIAYDFNISDKLILSPQYSYYFGLLSEFDELPRQTKSMRHYFGIGLQRIVK